MKNELKCPRCGHYGFDVNKSKNKDKCRVCKLSYKDISKIKRTKCPCCGYYTLAEGESALFDDCPICCWEYDAVMHDYPDKKGGANAFSLHEAQENYKKYGISDPTLLGKIETRKPLPEELPENNK